MEITVEMLNKYLEDFRDQQQKLTMQINALGGAIQAVEMIKKRLETDELSSSNES